MADDGTPIPRPGGDAPMTLLAIGQGYWLYEGVDLLDDLLFGGGAYPFPVRCLCFKDNFGLKRHLGEDVQVMKLWRVNPDIVDRLRRDDLLIEIFPDAI